MPPASHPARAPRIVRRAAGPGVSPREAGGTPRAAGASEATAQARGRDAVFLSGVRSGFGSFGGSLQDLSATQLGLGM